LLNSLALNGMLICSISTLVFNGNPLLRYDGYFILADLVEVPNLRGEASAALNRLLSRWCLGLEQAPPGPAAAARQGWLIAYAVASALYRWFVVLAVLWTLHLLARGYRLEVLVLPLVALTLVGMAWPVVAAVGRAVGEQRGQRSIAKGRLAITLLAVAAAVAAVVLIPLPERVSAPLVVEYRDAESIYVTVPGRLAAEVTIGQQVEPGVVLARLSSADVMLEVARLRGERDRQKVYLKNLESQRLQGVIDGSQIPTATATLAELDKRLAQLERDADELMLRASRAGTVLPPPAVPRKQKSTEELPRWTGTPLDAINQGSYLERGTLVCLVGDAKKFEAIAHIDEADVELVRECQRVRMSIDSLPGQTFWGTVADLARLDLKVMPRELAAAGDLPSRTDQRGAARPLDTWYQARVNFDDDPSQLVARVHGQAKIVVASQSVWSRLSRYLKQTFGR
jgi:putative peptide zinc metalloprotease protein